MARTGRDRPRSSWNVYSPCGARRRDRVKRYGDEAGLEEKFIQPVFKSLGWHLKYQTYLNRREPDYALFLSDDDLASAINAGRTSPRFLGTCRRCR